MITSLQCNPKKRNKKKVQKIKIHLKTLGVLKIIVIVLNFNKLLIKTFLN